MKISTALNILGLATVYTFQPWNQRAETLGGSLLTATRTIKKLKKQELIKQLEHYPYNGRSFRHNTFYAPIASKLNKIAYRELEHQFALLDVLAAFVYLYEDYDIVIDYLPLFKHKGRPYRPDAIVRLKGDKEYVFIIELERSRSAQAIYKEKLLKNKAMSFKEMGLPSQTKYLYIYAHERFNVYWRPMQYSEPKAYATIAMQESGFKHLLEVAQDLPDHSFRFLPLHRFTELDQPIWQTTKGNRVKLI